MRKRTDEKQDLRRGEGITENGENVFSHKTRERRTCHHAEERGEVGNDGVEGEVIGSVLVGQIDIGQRCHDRSRGNAEDVLGKADGDVEPDGIRRDEGIRVIGGGVDEKHDGERAEPIMPRDQLLPHIREENKEQKVGCVDAVAERIADADVIENVCVERCVGQIEREGIGCGDEDGAQKTLVFERKREDVGKLCFRLGRVRKFLGNKPDHAVNDGKRERDESDGDEHGELLRRTRKRIADRGNDERDGEGDGGVYAARGVEVVHAHVVGQEVGVPCGEAGGEQLVDGIRGDDQNDEPKQKHIGIGDEHRQYGDADNADGIIGKLAYDKDPFPFPEPLKENGGENVEQARDVRNKGQNSDTGFIQTVHQKEARVKKTSRKLTDESCHHRGEKHTESASSEVILYVIDVKQRTFSDTCFEIAEKPAHKDPFLPVGETFS